MTGRGGAGDDSRFQTARPAPIAPSRPPTRPAASQRFDLVAWPVREACATSPDMISVERDARVANRLQALAQVLLQAPAKEGVERRRHAGWSRVQSGSSRITAARTSVTDSPPNAAAPASIS